jgi:hypothetical protein
MKMFLEAFSVKVRADEAVSATVTPEFQLTSPDVVDDEAAEARSVTLRLVSSV